METAVANEETKTVGPVSEKERGRQSAGQADRSRRGSAYARRLLFVVLSALGTWVFCEASLRLFWHNPYRYEVPEHVLRLPVNHARTDHVVDRSAIDPEQPRVRFRTDERSYILPSRRFDRPDATVAFLGGSTTECMVVQEELRYPARVSYLLEKKGLKVNALNAGRSGNTTHDSINVLLNHIIEDKPDVIVLMHATNDIGVLSVAKSYRQRMGQTESFSHPIRFVLQKISSNFYFMGLLRKVATTERQRPAEMIPVSRQKREKAQQIGRAHV